MLWLCWHEQIVTSHGRYLANAVCRSCYLRFLPIDYFCSTYLQFTIHRHLQRGAKARMNLLQESKRTKLEKNLLASLRVRLGFSALLALVLLTFTAWPVHAFKDEPWSKDYKTWSNEDVQKILYESPWVKMV